MTAAVLRVIFDGMAWLYANQLKLQARLTDPNAVVTEEQFQAWRDEWANETRRQLRELEQDGS